MTSKRTVKNVKGERYLLTSRRIIELNNEQPWYALNKDIRAAAERLPAGAIRVRSRVLNVVTGTREVSLSTEFGKTKYFLGKVSKKNYRIGCAFFDFKTFKRILRNAGVKGTQKKAFAAKAGA